MADQCAAPEGRITLSNRMLIERRNGAREERVLSGEGEWRAKLHEIFGVKLAP
ncbi:MAG TPA: hypothetical protein VK579_14245 [Terriglobales bacterium]|nr:hypothetical protein [Terriglobales bacterium]